MTRTRGGYHTTPTTSGCRRERCVVVDEEQEIY